VITYVNPAVAAVLGVAILDETFTVAMGIGLGLVIVGSALATRTSSAARPDDLPTAAGPRDSVLEESPA
jgi:drug/metabolite transporter (DMT)-like permease